MKVNVKEFLEESGITEAFYPGKRLVHSCKQAGEYKNHCVVLDWRDPSKIRIEVKAGMIGKDLTPDKLKYYPVSLQTPTYVDIEVVNDNKEDEDGEETSGKSGKGGSSGGQKKKKKSLSEISRMTEAFGSALKGKIPEAGKIVEMVVMGTKIAADAYANVMGKLSHGIQHAKISTTDMLAQAGKFVTKYTPPSYMKPSGDENATYKYDREKNADIGYRPGMM
ncbi:MAG: hypothetical protein KTR28_01225 [Micavibrio sp.]|nr:hypothetical protein [Micavibrio sp.]